MHTSPWERDAFRGLDLGKYREILHTLKGRFTAAHEPTMNEGSNSSVHGTNKVCSFTCLQVDSSSILMILALYLWWWGLLKDLLQVHFSIENLRIYSEPCNKSPCDPLCFPTRSLCNALFDLFTFVLLHMQCLMDAEFAKQREHLEYAQNVHL